MTIKGGLAGNTTNHGSVDLLNEHSNATTQGYSILIPRLDNIGESDNSSTPSFTDVLKVSII